MTDEFAEKHKRENEAIEKVMEECRKCDSISQCRHPCGVARSILAEHNLRYQGDDP